MYTVCFIHILLPGQSPHWHFLSPLQTTMMWHYCPRHRRRCVHRQPASLYPPPLRSMPPAISAKAKAGGRGALLGCCERQHGKARWLKNIPFSRHRRRFSATARLPYIIRLTLYTMHQGTFWVLLHESTQNLGGRDDEKSTFSIMVDFWEMYLQKVQYDLKGKCFCSIGYSASNPCILA